MRYSYGCEIFPNHIVPYTVKLSKFTEFWENINAKIN